VRDFAKERCFGDGSEKCNVGVSIWSHNEEED